MPSAVSQAAGQEAIDLAASGGLHLDPAQQAVLRGGLGERADGRWAASQVVTVAPRQNGIKGGVFEARAAAGIYLFGERDILHTLHRYDSALDAFARFERLAVALSDQTGDPRLKLKLISRTNGDEYVELMNGAKVTFKTRAQQMGRGGSRQVIFLDEAMVLKDISALLPSLAAQDAPQIWWGGSAPLPTVESDRWRTLIRQCRGYCRAGRRPRRLAFTEWSAHVDLGRQPDGSVRTIADVDHTDRLLWAQANSTLGRRMTVEWVSTAELTLMSKAEFCRERLGLYDDIGEETPESVIDQKDWKACRLPDSRASGQRVFAFEVALDRSWSQIAVGAPSELGPNLTHVELVDNRPGTGWVVERLVELRDRWKPDAIVCNPAGPAGGLLPDCKRAGLDIGIPDEKGRIVPVSATDYKQACQSALDAIVGHRWAHIGQKPLDVAVSNTTCRNVGDAVVFDRRGKIDIGPFTAVTLAAWASGRPSPPPKVRDPIMIMT